MPHIDGNDDGIGYGVFGRSIQPFGVGVLATSREYIGLFAASQYDDGVYGESIWSNGVHGRSRWGTGLFGESLYGQGVFGLSQTSPGVLGRSDYGPGVFGFSDRDAGMFGRSYFNRAVFGLSQHGPGVYGESQSRPGVSGKSVGGPGVYGSSDTNIGIAGVSDNTGVFCYSRRGIALFASTIGSRVGYAAQLHGRVYIHGPLEKPGGSFKIDHPLDPANKYLHHSFVESPDMKNVYDGVVELGDKGEAMIELPDWFSALNKDFRYQLTAIGAPGPNLHIAEQISVAGSKYGSNNTNHFRIAGGTSGMKVSWQVTGIRKDPWVNANRIQVEEDKPAKERGYYIYPDLYGQSGEKGISQLLYPEEERWQEQLVRENKQPTRF